MAGFGPIPGCVGLLMGLSFDVNLVWVGFEVLGAFWDDSVGFERGFGPS